MLKQLAMDIITFAQEYATRQAQLKQDLKAALERSDVEGVLRVARQLVGIE